VTALAQLDAYAERIRVQVPAAPPNILDGYVRFMPWVSMIFGAFAALALLGLLGAATVISPLMMTGGGYHYGASLFQEIFFALVLTVLDIVGGYFMLQRKMTGWWLMTAALAVYLVQDLATGALLGLLITLLIAYIHIQVKPRYT